MEHRDVANAVLTGVATLHATRLHEIESNPVMEIDFSGVPTVDVSLSQTDWQNLLNNQIVDATAEKVVLEFMIHDRLMAWNWYGWLTTLREPVSFVDLDALPDYTLTFDSVYPEGLTATEAKSVLRIMTVLGGIEWGIGSRVFSMMGWHPVHAMIYNEDMRHAWFALDAFAAYYNVELTYEELASIFYSIFRDGYIPLERHYA